MGGPPSARVVNAGEVVLCDLAPRVNGTWADSCATVVLGEPTPDLTAAHAKVLDALHRAMEAIRPGVAAGEVDALARAGLDYPHHTGHGIGSSYHEEPRLVPGATTPLQAGMVIALEPALYAPGDFGIRLEHVVVVTADGCEDLSSHSLDLTAGPTDCSPMAGRHREVPAVPVSIARKDVA
jgi:Xaa-Pro aminopeptidase